MVVIRKSRLKVPSRRQAEKINMGIDNASSGRHWRCHKSKKVKCSEAAVVSRCVLAEFELGAYTPGLYRNLKHVTGSFRNALHPVKLIALRKPVPASNRLEDTEDALLLLTNARSCTACL